jgi:hypothetical protein
VSEYYDADEYGDGQEIRAEFTDGSSLTLVDIDGDGYADAVAYDSGDYTGYDTGEAPGYTEATGDEGYGTYPAGDTYDTGYDDGGSFYANSNLDTAVSTNPGGDEGYSAVGDGEFVSWG